MSEKKRIAVIFGGQSSEHEVSRVSAESVIRNIDRDKFDVVMLGITRDGRWLSYEGPVEKLGTGEWQSIAEEADAFGNESLQNSMIGKNISKNVIISPGEGPKSRKIDVIFPVLHGLNGEDGTIQGMLELTGIPYVGAGVLGSALGMDKAYAKIIFEKEGLPQARHLLFDRKQIKCDAAALAKKVEEIFSYPCFVKPSNAGSSVGVSKAGDRDGLIQGLCLAAEYDRRVLVEEFINGREFECGVLGNDEPAASVVGEVIPCNEFYDYDAKYNPESTSRTIIPADIPEETSSKIREYAVRAFKALDCAGLARVDFFVQRETGRVYLNEINTLPGFTSISMYPKLWEASGIPYDELIRKLIELAIERFEDNRRSIDIRG